nr:TonB-dependent receptor [Fodinibius sp.]NIV15761.1 TonB-dependent receptor [Fodinibius sp.]NIY29617.1 TonB-dependent receptor [Fodinibius sp.]
GIQLLENLEWSGNATFSRNKIEEYTYYLDNYDTGSQQSTTYTDTDIAFSPGFVGNSTLRFNYKGFAASLNTKYVSKQYLDNTQTESRTLDPYLVNDLRLSYNWNTTPLLNSLEATLKVNNIFDEMYESNGYTYGYIAGGERQFFNFYYPQAGRNIMLQLSFNF